MPKVPKPPPETGDEVRPEYGFSPLREARPRGDYAAAANGSVRFPESDVPPAFQRGLSDIELDPTRRASQGVAQTPTRRQVSLDMQEGATISGALVNSTKRAVPPFVAELAFSTASGKRFDLAFVEFQLVEHKGGDFIWSNKHQAIPLELTLRITATTGRLRVRLSQKTPPANAHEFLLMLRLQACLSEPVAVQLVDHATGIRVLKSTFIEGGGPPPPDPEFMALMEDLDAIQRKLQRPIRIVPGQEISPHDLNVLGKLRAILHEGGFTTSWTEYSPGVPAATAKKVLEAFSSTQAVLLRVPGEETDRLFGEQLHLGPVHYTFQAKLANESELREQLGHVKNDAELIKVQFIPADDPAMKIAYLDWVPQPPASESAQDYADPAGRLAQRIPEFMTILSDAEMNRLKTAANTLGLSPEHLLRASVVDLLNGLDDDARGDIDYILKENAELYRRLA